MKDVLILIPPSEGKSPGGDGPPLKKVPAEVQAVLDQLTKRRGGDEKLLGVKGGALKKAVAANRAVLTSPTLPAIERYTGVVYAAIDYPSLSKPSRIFFDTHVRIVSALFGLVAPRDRIPDYKLKIDKLGADKHWFSLTGSRLNPSFVIDLLPKAHQKAVAYENGVRVEFVVLRNGKAQAAGHQGKHIKGRFVRWLCQNRCLDVAEFAAFREDGFNWDGKRFVKEI